MKNAWDAIEIITRSFRICCICNELDDVEENALHYILSENESDLHNMHINETENIIILVNDDVKRLF